MRPALNSTTVHDWNRNCLISKNISNGSPKFSISIIYFIRYIPFPTHEEFKDLDSDDALPRLLILERISD